TAQYHIPGRAYADYAVLRGDPSDGLPGVAGVGEKTAAALVRTFGTVEAMVAAIEAGHGGVSLNSRPQPAPPRRCLAAPPGPRPPPARAPPRPRPRGGRPPPPPPAPAVDAPLPLTPAAPERLSALDERWDLGSSLRRAVSALADRPEA